MVVERKVATLARSLIRILIARRKEIARATITRSNVSKGGRGGGTFARSGNKDAFIKSCSLFMVDTPSRLICLPRFCSYAALKTSMVYFTTYCSSSIPLWWSWLFVTTERTAPMYPMPGEIVSVVWRVLTRRRI